MRSDYLLRDPSKRMSRIDGAGVGGDLNWLEEQVQDEQRRAEDIEKGRKGRREEKK
jgi:hypothetical protein